MKTLILMTGALALAACAAENDDAVAEVETDMVVEENTADMDMAATEGPGMPGTYVLYTADGELDGTAVNHADGTFSWTNADGETYDDAGVWENREGKMCIDPAEGEGEEDTGWTCWTRGETGEDGRTAWTSDADEPETVYAEESTS